MDRDKPWPVFLTLLLSCFITIEAAAFQAPAMPTIARHFGVTEDLTALIILLYSLGVVSLSPVMGRLADSFGRKRVLTSGLGLFTVAEFAAALAPTYAILLGARFLQGVAVAAILPVVLSYIAYLFPKERRGMPLGVFSAAMAVGGITGAILGGVLIDAFGWRSIYWASGAMALGGLLLTLWRTPETPTSDEPYRLDLAGAVLLLISIGALLSIPTWASRYSALAWPTLAAAATGVIGLALLWRVEQRATAPVISIDIFRHRGFLLPCLIYLLFLVCYGGSVYTLAFFINNRPDGSASQIGLVNTFIFGIGILGGLLCGKLLDRFSERSVVLVIVLLMLAGLTMFSNIAIDTPLWMVAGVASLLGLAQGMKGPAITKLALATVPPERYGAGSGMFSMMRDFGSPAGASIGLALFTTQRVAATEAALLEAMRNQGLDAQLLPTVKQAFDAGGLDGFPELAAQLQAVGADYEALAAAARLEGLAAALPTVGFILIGVVVLALVLALLLPKPAATARPAIA